MSGLIGALPFPATREETRARTRVDHKHTEEAALVRRVQARDEMAFREIVERYQSKVFSIIYGILRNRNDAEDIAQQVFAKVYFSIRNFDSRSSLLTWIYKITVNECYDYLRKKRVRKLVYESDFSQEDAERIKAAEPAVDSAAPVDTQLAQRDLIVKLLEKIPEEERSLILLKEVEGHSVEELSFSGHGRSC
jgi:RNA polymerase sigma-70 factor (ECF subfamily)